MNHPPQLRRWLSTLRVTLAIGGSGQRVKAMESRAFAVTAGEAGFRFLLRAPADGGRPDVICKTAKQDDTPDAARGLMRHGCREASGVRVLEHRFQPAAHGNARPSPAGAETGAPMTAPENFWRGRRFGFNCAV